MSAPGFPENVLTNVREEIREEVAYALELASRVGQGANAYTAEGKETRDDLNYTQPSDATELVEAIHAALCDYRMSNMGDEDECPYPLVDLCSNDGTTIDTGRAELFSLANYLVSDERVATFITQAQARATAAEGERDELRLAICGGEDAPGHNASLPHETILQVLRENYRAWGAQTDDACSSKGALFLVKTDLRAAQQTITQLTRELETARKVLRGAYSVMARAFGPLHSSPRTSNTEIAQQLGKSRAEIEAFLSSLSHQDEQG